MNSVILSGYICSDEIVLRRTPDEVSVTSFKINVTRSVKKKLQNNVLTIVCWNEMAEYAAKEYENGMYVEVRGEIVTGNRLLKGYDVIPKGKKEPVDFYVPVTEIYAHRVEIKPLHKELYI